MQDLFGLVGHVIESRYAVDAVVATGGFGVVYHATHTALGSAVALKVLRVPAHLPAHLHGAFAEQFRSEAKIIAALQHPAIVRVLDYGVLGFSDGSQAPWMALEWIDGVTLSHDLDARRGRGGRSPRDVLDLMAPVLDALAMAHAKGVAHRDIKPGNLMLPALDPTRSAAQGSRVSRHATPRLRLLDFGIAKVLGEGDGPASGYTMTGSQMAAYSPRYAAPEQASGTRTGPWTDVHALGLVLTELLVDAAPYPADKMELQIRVMAERRPTPATFGVDVGAWEPVLAKALALRPSERYANAGELLEALEATVPEARPLKVVVQGIATLPLGVDTQSASTTALSAISKPTVETPRTRRPIVWGGGIVVLAAVASVMGWVWTRTSEAPSTAPMPVGGIPTGSVPSTVEEAVVPRTASTQAETVERPAERSDVESAAALPSPAVQVTLQDASAPPTRAPRPSRPALSRPSGLRPAMRSNHRGEVTTEAHAGAALPDRNRPW